ncbi:Glutathione S-transferase 1-1 [Pseudolycoriella hygida]|uniref:glutathione transferase n=1 Tax=Pseudolycoriella hygida TaxID=35572 RepID=A0A9Q0S9E3_9DIPT|nr:Glutathione S-transferase 1-1 [Pseudolycoriella hygida]
MSTLTLYYTPPSPVARAVLFLIRYLDIDVDVKVLNLFQGEQHSEEFLKLNPAHEVPTLVDGDFVLTESRAILAYLINSRNSGSDLYPSDPKARARVDQRLSYDHVMFSRNTFAIRPVIFDGATAVRPADLEAVMESLRVINTFLENSKWIAGDNLTIADFSFVTSITSLVECGYDLSKQPNINRWYEQCKSLKGFDENLQGAKIIANVVKSKVENIF